MTTFLWIGVVFAGWFFLSCFVVVGLYACALWVDGHRRRVIERLSRVPDHVPVDWDRSAWAMDVTDRRSA